MHWDGVEPGSVDWNSRLSEKRGIKITGEEMTDKRVGIRGSRGFGSKEVPD